MRIETNPPAIIRSVEDAQTIVRHAKEALSRGDRSSWEVADDFAKLAALGWSTRRIAEECETNKDSVSRFIRCAKTHPVSLGIQRPRFWDAYREARDGKEAECGNEEAESKSDAASDLPTSDPRRDIIRAFFKGETEKADEDEPDEPDEPDLAIADAHQPAPQPVQKPRDDILRDAVGHKVPESVRPAFETVELFEEMENRVRILAKLVDEAARMKGGGEQLAGICRSTRSGESGDKYLYKLESLSTLKRDIRGVKPYSVCPYCKGSCKKDCRGCLGNGWISELTWKHTEDAIKARLSEDNGQPAPTPMSKVLSSDQCGPYGAAGGRL
jgi:hypothetical protein